MADTVRIVAVHQNAITFLTVTTPPVRERIGVPNALNVSAMLCIGKEADPLCCPLLVNLGSVVVGCDKPSVATIKNVGLGSLRGCRPYQPNDSHEEDQPGERDLGFVDFHFVSPLQ